MSLQEYKLAKNKERFWKYYKINAKLYGVVCFGINVSLLLPILALDVFGWNPEPPEKLNIYLATGLACCVISATWRGSEYIQRSRRERP
jgi:hypothetical protein